MYRIFKRKKEFAISSRGSLLQSSFFMHHVQQITQILQQRLENQMFNQVTHEPTTMRYVGLLTK